MPGEQGPAVEVMAGKVNKADRIHSVWHHTCRPVREGQFWQCYNFLLTNQEGRDLTPWKLPYDLWCHTNKNNKSIWSPSCPGISGWEQVLSHVIFSVQVVTKQKKPFPIQQSMMLWWSHAGQPEPAVCISDIHWRSQVPVGKRWLTGWTKEARPLPHCMLPQRLGLL